MLDMRVKQQKTSFGLCVRIEYKINVKPHQIASPSNVVFECEYGLAGTETVRGGAERAPKKENGGRALGS